jgi:hypothetical protein
MRRRSRGSHDRGLAAIGAGMRRRSRGSHDRGLAAIGAGMRRRSRGSHDRTFLAGGATVIATAAIGADATGVVLRPAQLGHERLAAQRSAHQLGRLGRGDKSAAFCLICSEYSRESAWRQVLAELGSSAPVALPGAFDASGQVVASQRCQRHRVADEHFVEPVIRRNYVEQPAHRCLLEPGVTRRMDALWPSSWDIACHAHSICRFELKFYMILLALSSAAAWTRCHAPNGRCDRLHLRPTRIVLKP